MKKRVGLLLIAITICFFSLGCNKTATIDNHIFETGLKNDSGYTWKSLRMDNEYIDNIECLVDDNIVYSKYENGVTNLVFYNYNITDKQTYRLGRIKDPYINSGDIVVVGNEVFFYCNRVVGTEKYPDGKLENSLYKINVWNHKLQKIVSDSTDQTLIYVKACKDKIISLKGKKNKKKSIMDILILLPMFIPPSAIGYIILITLGKNSFIGVILEKYFNIRIIFTIQACIIASVIVTLPLMYQSIKTSIFAIDQDIINASKLDGASDFKIFTKIILPLCKNGIYSGILLSFARSLGEFGATILVAGNIPGKTQTLPMAMYNAIEANQTKTTIIILFVILSISILLIIIYHNLNKDKI